MTWMITNSLCIGMPNSDEIYHEIAAFAEAWSARVIGEVADIIAGFRQYRRLHGEPDRSAAEYAFELLALGVI